MKKIIILSAFTFLAFATAGQGKTTLDVSGAASISVKPTITVLTITLQSKKPTYPGAVEDLIQRSNEITKTLTGLGFEKEEILTSTFSINKNTRYDRGTQIDDGYVGTQQVSVDFDMDQKKLLKTLEEITTSAARPEINLTFELDKESKRKLMNQLLSMAVQDAKEKAEIIAEVAGYTISGIESIDYNPVGGSPRPFAKRMSAEMTMDASVRLNNLSSEDLTFSDSISVVFQIVEKDN